MRRVPRTIIATGLSAALVTGLSPATLALAKESGQAAGAVYQALAATQDISDGYFWLVDYSSDYTGSAIIPSVDEAYFYNDDGDYVELGSSDYTLSYRDENGSPVSEIKNAGTYTVILTGKATAGYTGSLENTFTVYPAWAGSFSFPFEWGDQFLYTGSAVNVGSPTVTYDGRTLVEGTDFTVKITSSSDRDGDAVSPVKPGNYYMHVICKGNFEGHESQKFEVYNPDGLSRAEIDINTREYPWTGAAITPENPVVKLGDKTLAKDTDYTVKITAYDSPDEDAVQMKDVDRYYMQIIGKGQYEGTHNSISLRVANKLSLSDATVSFADGKDTFIATGQNITPKLIVKVNNRLLTEGTDYKTEWVKTTYDENDERIQAVVTPKEAGYYDLRLVGLGKYAVAEGNGASDFYDSSFLKIISTQDFGYADIEMTQDTYVYTGSAIKPEPIVLMNGAKLAKGTDYTVSYIRYDGNTKTPVAAPTEPGSYAAAVTGSAKYTTNTTHYADFEIIKGTDISEARILLEGDEFAYTGSAIAIPAPTVILEGKTLRQGTDYTVTYREDDSDNRVSQIVDPGYYNVIVQGTGSYAGKASREIHVYNPSESFYSIDVTLTNEFNNFAYTGSAIKPKPVSVELNDKKLTEGKDYKVLEYRFSDSDALVNEPTEIGEYRIVLLGLGTYAGQTRNVYYRIVEKSDITLGNIDMQSRFAYTDSVIKPDPLITIGNKILKNGTDYTVKYRYSDPEKGYVTTTAPKEIGYYSALILAKGSYTGEFTLYFRISGEMSAATAKLSTAKYKYNGKSRKPSVKVKVGSVKLVEGTDYRLIYPDDSKTVGVHSVTVLGIGDYDGTTTADFTIIPKATKIKKLAKGKKAFTATWKAVKKQNTGYELRYSLKKSMKSAKTVTVKKAKTKKKKVSKLKAGKKYYVQIRTYKKVGGEKIYSAWSKKKSVKTKK